MRFTKDHEWVDLQGDTATVGITAYAADQLGDVVFVDLPDVGKSVAAGDALAVVESVKAASDVYAPIGGEVTASNPDLSGNPETVNAAPETSGWFVKIKGVDAAQVDALMDRAAYEAFFGDAVDVRYLPLTAADRHDMLGVIGAASIDDLFVDVPASARLNKPVDLPHHAGELAVERALSALAAENRAAGGGPFFCGAGAYRHHVPASVDHLIQRSEFLTSYTPYQPEIAQGTLQVLFEFQTQVAALLGLPVANASMYDGSTGCAEAVLMACRATRRSGAVLSGGLHPHYAEAAHTLAVAAGVHTQRLSAAIDDEAAVIAAIGPDTACVVVQSPNVFGTVTDVTSIAEAAHAAGALMIVVTTEAVSLGLLKSPGEMGADIAVAEGQSIGNGLNFGGPYVGLFACTEKLTRQMPGRLCGQTVDAEGRRGFVLTLSTREQHIRRDKATSNICTNSGLCALAFTIHMSLLGGTGLRTLAEINHARAVSLKKALANVPGVDVLTPRLFNEFAVRLPANAAKTVDSLVKRDIIAGVPFSRLDPGAGMDDVLLVCATETTTAGDIDAFADALAQEIAA